MKKLACSCCAAVAACATFSAAAPQESTHDRQPIKFYHGVLFEKIVGGIKKLKPEDKVETCQIKTDHAEVTGRLVELAGLIDTAAKQPLIEAFHFVAQIPSIEIYATQTTFTGKNSNEIKTERILLVKDYETLHTRQGKEAENLIKLINQLCPIPAEPTKK